MDSLHQYSAFAGAARHGSFAAAARELGVAPSTLAKAVGRLEAALAVRLFHRTTRQVRLTADGERLFARCERVLAEIDALHADAAGTRAEPRGTLRMDMPVWYGRRFGTDCPPLMRVEDGIDRHLVRCTRLGIALDDGAVYAPDGFDDMWNGILRPNPIDPRLDLFRAKCRDYRARWPWLSVAE